MKKKIVFIFLISFTIMNAQSKFVKGIVTDPNMIPLPGVSIIEKGTSNGVTTDFEGNFNIEVSSSEATLVFSYVGMQTLEIAVGNQERLDIALQEDASQLDEIVIVGYGSQKQSDITGSISRVDVSKTEAVPSTNVSEALRGRVAGVQFTDGGRPGQSESILIRGKNSISASNSPLIILDGSFFFGSMGDLNPNDIKSMSILKDASATAIYGSRASNGVILITSKLGTSSKPVIKFSSFYGIQKVSHKLPMLSPERYIQKTLDVRKQLGLPSDPSLIESYLAEPEVENYRNNKTIDPYEKISQSSHVSSTDISASARNKDTNYFLSLGHSEEKGLILDDNFKRITARINLTTNINDWIKLGMNAMFTHNDLSRNPPSTRDAYYSSPYGQWYEDSERTIFKRYPTDDQFSPNPLINGTYQTNENKNYNLFSTFFFEIDFPFVEGLTYKLNYSPNYIWSNINDFTSIIKDEFVDTEGRAQKYHSQTNNWVAENILTYKRTLAEKHAFNLTLLYGRNSNNFSSTIARSSNFFNDANGWDNLGIGEIQTNSSSANISAGISSMFRLNYNFNGKYGLTLTARRDGASVFGKDNKFATFPSAAVSWNASNESFMKNVNWLDLLKFRISYGNVGNQAIEPYQSLAQSGSTQYVFGDGSSTYVGTFPSTLPNESLTWETTTIANIAIDFGFLKNRISGTLEYYDTKTKDLLLDRSLPSTSGFPKIITNLGEVNNRGVELTLSGTIVNKDKFKWYSDFVLSHNKNKIVHLYGNDIDGDGKEDDDLGNRWFIGKPISVNYDYVFDGIYQVGDEVPAGYKPGDVRLKDIDGSGDITPADRQIISNQDPKIRWGFTNEFKYKNYSLSIFVNAMQGWSKSNSIFDLAAEANFPAKSVNMADIGWWTEENESNTRPSLTYSNPLEHGYYESRDFVRIQDISLSYNLPEDFFKNEKTSLKLYISGRNLFTFTDWNGWDPESGYTGNGGYPSPKTFALGLSASF